MRTCCFRLQKGLIMIGIIGAMEEEVSEILKYVDLHKTNVIQGYKFHEGKINGNDVVLMQSGIGKVNSTLSTTFVEISISPIYFCRSDS